MRLIELRLKNLNSLKGEWRIDFSDKAFVTEGIFAITGQTGAGKTTILDAICLALYGETPRINSISKSGNEVMTRQTGECFAEVVIELSGAQYRCRWGQRRAYGKPDGNLQDATHEIAKVNLDDPDKGDEILEEKLSRTKERIISLTSMDFQQFTRSILLAQGSFSAFLQAKADERADILEKITGTDIYSDISKYTHSKYRSEREALERMQAVAQGLSLLDADSEAQYRERVGTLSADLQVKRATQAGFEAQIKWLDAVADLQAKQTQYTQDVQDAEQARLAFGADAKRLDRAIKALEIDNSFNQLVMYRKQVQSVQAERQQGRQDLRQVEGALSQNKADLDHAISAEQTASRQYEKAQPVIAEVRRLNGQILQCQQQLSDKQTRHEAQASHIAGLKATVIASNNEQGQLQDRLATATEYLATHSHFESLARDIESFHQRGLQVKTLLSNAKDKALHRQQALDSLTQLTQKLTTLKESQQQADADIEAKKSEVEALKGQNRNLLQGQTLQTLRHQQNEIDHSSQQLSELRAQFGQIAEVSSQVKALLGLLPDSHANIAKLQRQIEANEHRLARLNTEFDDKKSNVELLQQVAKLEDFIDLLQDDKPCPLCGSLEHPYVGNHPLQGHSQKDLPTPSPTSSPIVALKNRLAELSDAIDDVKSLIAEDKIALATSKHELNGYHKQLQAQFAQVSKLVADSGVQIASFEQYASAVSPTLLARFDKFSLLTTLNDSQQSLGAIVDNPVNEVFIEDLDNIIKTTAHSLTLLQEVIQELASQKQSLNKVLDDNDKLTQKVSHSEMALKALQDKAQNALQEINTIDTDIKLAKQRVASDESDIEGYFTEIERLVQSIRTLASAYQSDDSDKWTTLDTTLSQISALKRDKQALTLLKPETDIEPLREYCRGMRQRQQHYEQQRALSQSLSGDISNLTTKITGINSQLVQLQGEQTALTTAIKELQTNLKSHQEHRQTLYHKMASELAIEVRNIDADIDNIDAIDKINDIDDIDNIDKRLRLAVDNARQTLSEVRERHNNNQQRIEQLKQQALKRDKEITETSEKLEQQHNVFAGLLTDNEFADESDFKDALLERETREALARQQQQIERDVNIAHHKLEDSKQQLAEKLANPLVASGEGGEGDKNDKATLTTKLSAIENEISQLNKQIGALEQKLKDNDANKANQQAQLEAIAQQKQTLTLWGNLHKLIGSESGKKYRTFAQGLTFQIMVSHANSQLQKMSDRYLLTRDNDSPLELNVIDNYQGGEVRSTKNLSGGEGFIISLALALGLSNMASQNISVDSLFLDEGFGTLDEDSLDIALDTLTNLQAEGKLIGVISHVQALKARILTQIKVEKISGGYSQISGSGCYKIG